VSPVLVAALLAVAPAAIHTSTEVDGLDLVVVTTGGGSCSARLAVRAGADDDPTGKAGLAHLVEHVSLGGDEGAALLASAESQVNAFTFADGTIFTLDATAASCAAELTRLLSVATTGKLRRAWVEHEQSVIQREQMYSRRTTSGFIDAGLFGDRMISILGSPATRENIKLDDVVRFYRTHYTPAKMALVVVGPLDVEKVRAALRAGFKLPPVLPGERTERQPSAVKFQGDHEIANAYAGVNVLSVPMPAGQVELCQNAAALLELRVRRALRLSGTTQVAGECLVAGGQLVAATMAIGPESDRERVQKLVGEAWDKASAPTAEERKLLARRFSRAAEWLTAAPEPAADLLARAALWSQGEALFSQVSGWLSPQLADAKGFAQLPGLLAKDRRVSMSGRQSQ